LRAAVNLLQLVIIIIAAAAERIDLFSKVNLRSRRQHISQREIREKQRLAITPNGC
jgi:hypothetical protein